MVVKFNFKTCLYIKNIFPCLAFSCASAFKFSKSADMREKILQKFLWVSKNAEFWFPSVSHICFLITFFITFITNLKSALNSAFFDIFFINFFFISYSTFCKLLSKTCTKPVKTQKTYLVNVSWNSILYPAQGLSFYFFFNSLHPNGHLHVCTDVNMVVQHQYKYANCSTDPYSGTFWRHISIIYTDKKENKIFLI